MDSIDDPGAAQAGEGVDSPVGSEVILSGSVVVVAHAALQYIRRLWRVLFGGPWFTTRCDGDEHAYQMLRDCVLDMLPDVPAFDRARQVALDALPDMLLTSDDLECLDGEIRAFYESGFQRLEAELVRLAIREGSVLGDPAVWEYFESMDDFLNRVEPLIRERCDREARRLGLLPPASPPPAGATGKAPRRTGPNKAQLRAAQLGQEARRLQAEGLTIKEIARRLGRSPRAVSGYVADAQ